MGTTTTTLRCDAVASRTKAGDTPRFCRTNASYAFISPDGWTRFNYCPLHINKALAKPDTRGWYPKRIDNPTTKDW